MRQIVSIMMVLVLGLSLCACKNKKVGKIDKGDPKTIDSRAAMFNVQGLQSTSKGDYATASRLFKKAIELKEDGEFYNNIGRCYYWLGRFDDSLAAYSRAEELGLNNAGLKGNIGDVFRQRKDFTEAMKYYHQALNLDPNFARIHYELGDMYLNEGQYKDAEERLSRALEIDPGFTKAQLARVIVYRLTNDYENAYADMCALDRHGIEINEDLRQDILRGTEKLRQRKANSKISSVYN